ncbi:MAG: metallophosphoesterase [Bacteroidetes bacterium]|nr:metallophosphoesterase [Bacteroidota bacterium]
MQSRRKFLYNSALAVAALALPDWVAAEVARKRLTILHTNDTHSRMEPFPMDGGKYQGLGGVAARAAFIEEVRSSEQNVLLLDAGDIFQGTPYFNIYKGEPEMKAMQRMGYDACTMGNHDFDGGLENFAQQLTHVHFPVVICNYDFIGTVMEHKYQPYHIVHRGGLKIGITGVGIQLEGLVGESLSQGVKYADPITPVNQQAAYLKSKGCDLVICLSHLGYEYPKQPEKISDVRLAAASDNIDLIIGGHTHTFMDAPVVVNNIKGKEVVIHQAGWGGIKMGRIEYEFNFGFPKKVEKKHSNITLKKRVE